MEVWRMKTRHKRSRSTRARRAPRGLRRAKASSADILVPMQPARRIVPKWRTHHAHLRKLRDELINRQTGLSRDALEQQPNFSSHLADAGTDTFDRDFALGMLSSEQDALYEIDEALKRIENATYGICELTGKPIAAQRLAVIPWTRFSAEAEKRLEREGNIKRAGLGGRATVGKSGTVEI